MNSVSRFLQKERLEQLASSRKKHRANSAAVSKEVEQEAWVQGRRTKLLRKENDAERQCEEALSRIGISFIREAHIDRMNGKQAFIDFLITGLPEGRCLIALEIDGSSHAGHRASARDRQRDVDVLRTKQVNCIARIPHGIALRLTDEQWRRMLSSMIGLPRCVVTIPDGV